MTRLLTGEEYGCANIHKTNSPEYSCKLLHSKNWLLKVISPEEHKRNFTVEIIQDKLSSSSRKFIWNHFSVYGDSYIKHFNLKTYEEGEITSLKLHFFHQILKISEISLIDNYSEYKFRTNGESKILNNLVKAFSQITKEKIHNDETSPSMETDISLLAVMILFLLSINIILSI
ncbi:uncharacterized protein LOC115227221, partial [Octopus sinensis]|uniref:Uncharacterized protein LOC115227221 n=1 Tax=Octopus sinensis TaxID=2607531 RepID=A0A6P7TZ17_9MOLL